MEEETLEDTNSGMRYLKKKEPGKESEFEERINHSSQRKSISNEKRSVIMSYLTKSPRIIHNEKHRTGPVGDHWDLVPGWRALKEKGCLYPSERRRRQKNKENKDEFASVFYGRQNLNANL